MTTHTLWAEDDTTIRIEVDARVIGDSPVQIGQRVFCTARWPLTVKNAGIRCEALTALIDGSDSTGHEIDSARAQLGTDFAEWVLNTHEDAATRGQIATAVYSALTHPRPHRSEERELAAGFIKARP